MSERRFHISELGLIGIAAVWGLTFPMVDDAVDRIPVMTFLAYRFIPAGLLVAVVAGRRLRTLGREGLMRGLVMGTFLTAGYIFQTMGLERTSPSHGGFITGLFVVLTPLFGALLFGHRSGSTMWAAVAIATIGLFLLTGGQPGEATFAGDALTFLCACSFAFHFLVTGDAVKKHDVIALLAVQLTLCGVVALVAALVAGDLEIPRSGEVWSALLVTSLVASALGFFVQTYAQQHASPARTALILASEPAFAGLFSYLLAGETLTLIGWLGAALIMGAIVLIEAAPYIKPVPPLPET